MDYVTVTLPHGFWSDGICHRDAELRPLTGADEAFLLDEAEALLPVQRTTALLARCVVRLGSLATLTPDVVRMLTVGDREALLLHLRRLTLGDRLPCVVACSFPGCGVAMDLELRVSALLVPPSPEPRPYYEKSVGGNGSDYRVRFRLPTGLDQETAAVRARESPHGAAELVLRRCVEQVASGSDGVVDELPATVADQLPGLMGDIDPQARTVMTLTCIACQRVVDAVFDAGSYLCRELASRRQHLDRDVHLLALHYHWGEAEIMGMPSRKRRRYVDALTAHLGGEGTR